jgi:hypothetical protein
MIDKLNIKDYKSIKKVDLTIFIYKIYNQLPVVVLKNIRRKNAISK